MCGEAFNRNASERNCRATWQPRPSRARAPEAGGGGGMPETKLRTSARGYQQGLSTVTRFGKTRLRYVFTIEDVRLICGSGLLQPADPRVLPSVTLTWRSGKKQASGGAVFPSGASLAGNGATWPAPLSLICALTSSAKSRGGRFESRPSEVVLKIAGAKGTRRKLIGTLDLAAHAGYEASSLKAPPPPHAAAPTPPNPTASWRRPRAFVALL